MSIIPIKCSFVGVRRSDLFNDRILVGIDSGSTLTKVTFLHKDRKTQFLDEKNDLVVINHALFKNEDFDEAIKWTREQAYLPESTDHRIHITGRGSFDKKDVIESIFGRKIEYVEESLALIAGHRIALEQIGLDNLVVPPVEIQNQGQIRSQFFENFTKSLSSKFSDETNCNRGSSVFPCLIHMYGSMSKFYYFDEEGKAELLSGPLTAGTAFLGLAKCLLDTNNYSEIVEMALTGNRGNVDTQVKDMLECDIDSPYGKFPSELPIFAFGKSMDFNKGLEDYAKEDVAISLVAFISKFITSFSVHACQMKRTKKIYLSGNIFISNIFQKEIKKSLSIFPFMNDLEILDLGYSGALGAMFCNNNDKTKYCKN